MKNVDNLIADAKVKSEQSSIKSPVFLFGKNESHNRQGNYFDGEDPYRENIFEFYSLRDDGQVQREKTIRMDTEPGYGTPKVVSVAIEAFYEKFRQKHPGHPIVVLSITDRSRIHHDKTLQERVDDAIRKYREDHRAEKLLPAYIPAKEEVME